MAEDLQDIIRRLSVGADNKPQVPTFPQSGRGDYSSRTGVGSRYTSTAQGQQQKKDDVVLRDSEFEVVTVYSYILVTEDGAFEMPTGWPTTSAYPNPTQVYGTLPASLILDGSTLSLDQNADVYMQRRVHAIYYYTPGVKGFRLESLNVELEQPYRKLGFYAGIIPMSWTPQVQTTNDGSNLFTQRQFVPSPFLASLNMSVSRYYDDLPDVQKLATNLFNLGVSIEST